MARIDEKLAAISKQVENRKKLIDRYNELKELYQWLGDRWLPLIMFRGNSSDAYFEVNFNGQFIKDQIKAGFDAEIVRLQNEIMKPIADD